MRLSLTERVGIRIDARGFGTLFNGRITGRTRVGDFDAILPELEGSAWITGEHVFLVDDEDPLKAGFRL